METKECFRCKIVKNVEDFRIVKKTNTLHSWCRKCCSDWNKLFYQNNGDKRREYGKKYYYDNIEKSRKYHREWARQNKEYIDNKRKQNKKDVMNGYGGKCNCCGETNIMFLTIDHINNDGNKMRKVDGAGSFLYSRLVRENYPSGFQILCYNCNIAKHHNGGTCPHNNDFKSVMEEYGEI